MNERKLKQLIAAARLDAAPAPPEDFAADVLRAIRREPASRRPDPLAVLDHLNGLFPRVALAAVGLMLLCVASDAGLTAAGLPGLGEGAAQVMSQYLFTGEDL